MADFFSNILGICDQNPWDWKLQEYFCLKVGENAGM